MGRKREKNYTVSPLNDKTLLYYLCHLARKKMIVFRKLLERGKGKGLKGEHFLKWPGL